MVSLRKPGLFFRSAYLALAITFLWQQVSWAGDIAVSSFDKNLKRFNDTQAQTFAPGYLRN